MKSAKEILTSHNKFHINLGLERIEKILKLLKNPQDKYKIIHIAGTNGKGSVSKIINEMLIENFKDKKIGLFTSPHLFCYEERIRVNNEKISSYALNRLINNIDDLAQKNNIELSEFELLCAGAFYYFFVKQADYVVLETGLGGLFDATNIVSKPVISIITTIDFDHKERLGSTIDEIASQKAGIIKKNSKVIVSKDNLGYKKISENANEKNAQIIDVPEVKVIFEDKNYAVFKNKKYEFNLLGAHQAKNLALALSAAKILKIKEKSVENALKKVQWDFRMEYLKEKNILIDCAHNPSGAKALRGFLDENFKNTKKTFIFGCLKNKDYEKMLNILKKEEDELYFFEFNYQNALKFSELDKNFKAKKIASVNEIKNIIDKNKNLKVFCGSIYMLGSIFCEIKIK